jgi:hypothetical protein
LNVQTICVHVGRHAVCAHAVFVVDVVGAVVRELIHSQRRPPAEAIWLLTNLNWLSSGEIAAQAQLLLRLQQANFIEASATSAFSTASK